MNKAVFFLLLLLIASCSIIGINLKRKAPGRAGKYPAFTEKDSLIGYLNQNRACYDVYYYNLNISFSPEHKTIKGYVDIHFSILKNTSVIQVDLNKNMTIDEVQSGSEKLNYKRRYDAVVITFNKSLNVNDKSNIRIYYHGKPVRAKRPPWEGGVVWKKDKRKNPWAGVACEQIGARLWWPLKDHISDEPDSVLLNFTIPTGLYCVSNGRLISRVRPDNKTETFTWKITYPVNSYNITFYIGDYVNFTIPYDSIPMHDLDFYVLRNNLDKAKNHFKQAKDILQFYETIYGPYAFFNDGYKLVESPYEGMEHQSAIAYGNGYKNNTFGYDYIILHETAHEWWGNAVSVKDYSDIWLHEGFATYSEALFLEKQQGYERYINYINFYAILVANKKPMVGPRDVNYWDYHDSDPYMKGALTLHSLRSTIGNDKVFFDILRSFYTRFTYKTVSSGDFINVVNEHTKSNYDWFFKQFLYNRKPAKLTYRIIKNKEGDDGRLIYKWTDTDSDFIMPVDVNDINGSIIRLYPTAKEKTYVIKNLKAFSINNQAFYFTKVKMK